MNANPHKIIAASALPNTRSVRVVWEDGRENIIDLSRFLGDFAVFAPLDDDDRFAQVLVGEWGFAITWDAGGDMSIAASTVYRLAAEQSDDPAQPFDAWMARQGFSNAAAGQALGLPGRTVSYYRTGKKPVPKVVQLVPRPFCFDRPGHGSAKPQLGPRPGNAKLGLGVPAAPPRRKPEKSRLSNHRGQGTSLLRYRHGSGCESLCALSICAMQVAHRAAFSRPVVAKVRDAQPAKPRK